jgi:hypothetical protein
MYTICVLGVSLRFFYLILEMFRHYSMLFDFYLFLFILSYIIDHKPMHYNGTEIDTNIQCQYLHAHDKMMDVTQ